MKLGISGILGRMGKLVYECANESEDFSVNLGIDKTVKEFIPGIFASYSWSQITTKTDVIIDFTNHEITPELLGYAIKNKTPIVIGTTGHTTEELIEILKASKEIPIMLCPNTSLGATYLISAAKTGAEFFAERNYEIDISETHHSKKQDAPSGTALAILNAILSVAPSLKPIKGLENIRTNKDVIITSKRIGGVFGDHEVSFASEGEIISIAHRVTDRKIFAEGALECARFIVDKKPGLYKTTDIFQTEKKTCSGNCKCKQNSPEL